MKSRFGPCAAEHTYEQIPEKPRQADRWLIIGSNRSSIVVLQLCLLFVSRRQAKAHDRSKSFLDWLGYR
jgi:hypothetical protein